MRRATEPDHPADGRPEARSTAGPSSWGHRAESYVKRKLRWGRFYRALICARSALWVVPLFAIVPVLANAPTLRILDAWLGWQIAGLDVAGAQALFQTVVTLTLSFMVFTFGSLLAAIQVAVISALPSHRHAP